MKNTKKRKPIILDKYYLVDGEWYENLCDVNKPTLSDLELLEDTDDE